MELEEAFDWGKRGRFKLHILVSESLHLKKILSTVPFNSSMAQLVLSGCCSRPEGQEIRNKKNAASFIGPI